MCSRQKPQVISWFLSLSCLHEYRVGANTLTKLRLKPPEEHSSGRPMTSKSFTQCARILKDQRESPWEWTTRKCASTFLEATSKLYRHHWRSILEQCSPRPSPSWTS